MDTDGLRCPASCRWACSWPSTCRTWSWKPSGSKKWGITWVCLLPSYPFGKNCKHICTTNCPNRPWDLSEIHASHSRNKTPSFFSFWHEAQPLASANFLRPAQHYDLFVYACSGIVANTARIFAKFGWACSCPCVVAVLKLMPCLLSSEAGRTIVWDLPQSLRLGGSLYP